VEKYLKRCIDSILEQTYTNFELLLVDDGSPDGCPAICDSYAKKDKRVRVIHKKNGGLTSARNAGIENAIGNYICYVDGDDWIDDQLLDMVYDKAIASYAPDIIIFGIEKIFENYTEKILCDLSDGLYDKKAMNDKVYPYMMYDSRRPFCKGLIFPAACNKIYRRKLLVDHHCRDEQIRMGEDNAFVYESVWYSNRIYILNKILYFYDQMNPAAMNHSYDAKRFYNNKCLFDYMSSRLKNKSDILDKQLNAFNAYWIIMAVFHEIKNKIPLWQAVRHIKEGIKENNIMSYVSCRGLPKSALVYILMLKLKLYRLVILSTYIVQMHR